MHEEERKERVLTRHEEDKTVIREREKEKHRVELLHRQEDEAVRSQRMQEDEQIEIEQEQQNSIWQQRIQLLAIELGEELPAAVIAGDDKSGQV